MCELRNLIGTSSYYYENINQVVSLADASGSSGVLVRLFFPSCESIISICLVLPVLAHLNNVPYISSLKADIYVGRVLCAH